jgi:ABC-type multidrug transport system fused ATPase/permease subunit
LTNILASEIREVNGAAIEQYIFIVHACACVITSLIVAVYFSWLMGIVGLVTLPITVYTFIYANRIRYRGTSKDNEQVLNQKRMTSDTISNYPTIASLANEDYIISKYFTGSKQTIGDFIIPAFFMGFSVFWGMFIMVILFFILADKIENDGNLDDQFTTLIMIQRGFMAISMVTMKAPDLAKGVVAAKKLINITESAFEGDQKCKITNGVDILTPELANGNIQFSNVSFRYPGTIKYILRHFNLTIKSGESVGIIGPSGHGKSTLVQLLLRFYQPQHGRILISGIPIDKFTLSSLRKAYGWVQQEPIMFDDTVYENIRYGKSHATAKDILTATEAAFAHEFIKGMELSSHDKEMLEGKEETKLLNVIYSKLPEGYQVNCGHKGGRLSGGQKQRIAIARALVRDPQIMLFDEATSALDEESQKEVQIALDHISKTKTSLVIAHRLSTLDMCDRIVDISKLSDCKNNKL